MATGFPRQRRRRKSVRFAAVLALGLLAVAATRVPAGAVVGPSTPGSPLADSLVMVLNRQGATAGFCTGIVLAPTVVLTAAHCVPAGADVRVHYHEDEAAPLLLPVAAVVRHPGYRPDAIRRRERSIDLALIRLPTPLPPRFVSAPLSDVATATQGQSFVLSGFGLGQEADERTSGTLRSVTLAARSPLSDVLLWADDPTRRGGGACTGDSGAPVLAPGGREPVALVVWSAGVGSHRCGDLTQALWLAPWRSWIDATLAAWRHG